MAINPRLLAAHIIESVTNGQSLADCLPLQLTKLSDTRDRAFVQAICYSVCRYYSRLDAVLSHLLTKPMNAKDSDVHALLLVGLCQLMEMHTAPHAAVSETVNAVAALKKPWARGLVNAVLREYLRRKDQMSEMIDDDVEAKFAHPIWWIIAIRKAWKTEWEQILLANNEHPPFSLRVNTKYNSVEKYLELLQQAGMPAHKIANTAEGVILTTPVAVEALPGFGAGHVTVQDGAAQLAASFMQLKPNLRVLDACSAPGGKLTHILELEPTTQVVAVEKDKSRLAPIQENLSRLQQQAKVICADAADISQWWDNQPFDRILLDAPCSASGVIRRHPDIKLLRQPTDLVALQKEQYKLLKTLWQTLAPNGILVYATCSVLPEENHLNIEKFLAEHADAIEEKISLAGSIEMPHGIQILPGVNEMDGFYYAVIRKAP